MNRIFVIILLLSAFNRLSAYSEPDWSAIEDFLEENYSENELSTALDQLEYYFRYPIKLIYAKPYDLTNLPTIDTYISEKIITRFQANSKLKYSALFDSLNLSRAQKHIIYFATSTDTVVNTQKNETSLKYSLRNESRLEQVRGIKEKKYLGDSYDILQKFNAKHSNFEINALVNKNLGEVHLAESYSLGARYSGKNLAIVVGDFAINSGMGNILWQSFSMSKGSELISAPISYSNSLRLNNSTIQLSHFRGVSAEYSFGINDIKIKIVPFYSNLLRAATIDTANNLASSIYSASYFRTQNEIRKKDALREIAYGGTFELSKSIFQVGASLLCLTYAKPIESSSSTAIRGSNSKLGSIFSFMNFGKLIFGAEFSANEKNETAMKLAASYRLYSFSASLHYRDYSAKFRSPYGYNFGESTSPANEKGVYLGVLYRASDDVSIESYIDFYKTYTRTYTVQMPIVGVDWAGKVYIENAVVGDIFMKAKIETKTDGYKAKGSAAQTIFDLTRNELRFELKRKIMKNMTIRARIDGVYIDFEGIKPSEVSFAGFLEIDYRIFDNLKIKARNTMFSTESYSSAIWHFEYRMPGSSLANALYESGNRTLVALDWKLYKIVSVNFAYTRLEKYNKSKLGTSYDEINGNKDNRFYFQLAVNF